MNNIPNKQINEKLQVARQTSAWWHHGYAWLVFGGPAAVVIASLITAYIAVSHRDALVDEDYYRKGIEINKMLSDQTLSANKSNSQIIAERNALAPAMLARNHAATGVIHQQ